ncbi:MAG: glucose-6-phosphate isomerase [Clostridia bacterium]|nr:glucose-6-phosphate isomerase [Clostridia bacterium]
MTIRLDDRFVRPFLSDYELKKTEADVEKAIKTLRTRTGAGAEMLGWLDLPEAYDKEEFARIKAAAAKIRSECDVFIVIGIGGSYLGSRAVIEFLKSPRHNLLGDGPRIFFSGCNISDSDLDELTEICRGKNVCINVISKSGTTTEPAISFRYFRAMIEEKYGKDGARDHIFVTTDKCRGTLKKFSDEAGYETFVVPDAVGGRFSVLTAVGLLPIAVAGIDIDELMGGARDAMKELDTDGIADNPAYNYALIRNTLYRQGKAAEILVGYAPYLLMLNEWWKQLYGESEGKDGKGLYPSSVIFSTDLHSLGQFIQSGERMMFETVLNIEKSDSDAKVPFDAANVDGLNFVAGTSLAEINNTALNATVLAHVDGGVPNVILNLKDRSAHSLGYLIYFFELACAVSGYTLGVNPFDQPGVEAYKKNMFALLGKPGYEDMADALRARLK